MRRTALLIPLLTLACGDGKKPPETKAPVSAAAASAPSQSAPQSAPQSAAEAPASAAPESKAAASEAPVAGVTVAPVAISATLDEAGQRTRMDLAGKILDGKLKGLALRNRKNAPFFLDLAASHPHPKVVAGALGAMSRTFTRDDDKGTPVDEDYRKVVRVRLEAKDQTIRLAALGATRLLVSGKPEAPFVDLLIAAAKSEDEATRTRASRILTQLSVVQTGEPANDPLLPKVLGALVAAAKDAPASTAATIMERLARPMTATTPHRAELAALALANRASADPGVRGAANLLFATTATDKAATAKALVADLAHADGYVRGATLEALGLLGHAPAVHAIVERLDDEAGAVHQIQTKPRPIPLALDYGRQVNHVALGALRDLSKKGFDFDRGDLKREPAAVIAAAKAWYKKAQKQIPPL